MLDNDNHLVTGNISLNYNDVESVFSAKMRQQLCFNDLIDNLKEEDIESALEMTEGMDKVYVESYISFAVEIFYKNRKILKKLLSQINKKNKACELKEYTTEFAEYTLERSIIEDDVDSFIRILEKTDETTLYSTEIYIGKRKLKYSETILFFGALKVFKYSLLSNTFDFGDLGKFAIAGGNIEIIHILEQKENYFDDCLTEAIKYHRHNICNWLLSNYKCDPPSLFQSFFNDRAFYFIAANRININDYNIFSEISRHFEIHNKEFIRVIFENKIEKPEVCMGETFLHVAVKNNLFDIAKYLIDHNNENIEAKNFYCETALTIAVKNSNFEIIKYLIEEKKANINEIDLESAENEEIKKYLNNPSKLHKAVESNDFELVKSVCEKEDQNINWKFNGKTALAVAVEKGNLDIVKYLIDVCHSDIKTRDDRENTLLHYAAQNNNLEMIKYLIEECHIPLEIKNINKKTELSIASNNQNIELCKYFIEVCNESADYIITEDLETAIKTNNFDFLDLVIKKGKFNTAKRDERGDCIIHYAVREERFDVVKYLVEECSVNANCKNMKWETALDIATINNNTEIMEYLTEKCINKVLIQPPIFI